MTTMLALRAHHRGGPEVLVYEPAPKPVPAPGEVLIAVHAAAITFAELTWDETWSRGGVDRTPIIPSHEVSGVVADVAADVDALRVGDPVYGLIPFDRNGAAAEYVTVPATDVAAKPRSVSDVIAAAVPLAALTAWQALIGHAKVQADDRVLVLGGAGGVGAFVTQIAARLGARVTATVLAAAVDHALALGADRAINVDAEAFDAQTGVFDVVIDTVGGQTLERSWATLRRGGRLVTLQAPPSRDTADAFGVDAMFFVVSADRGQLGEIAELVDDGSLRVTIAATFPLAKGRAAFDSGATFNRPPGKTVLVVRDEAGG
jgi:NADPH:quinone reductase-like Zn-dependent oxidoreductase